MLINKALIFLLMMSSLFAKEIIAVLDLEQIGLTPQEATILTQRLTTELISLDKYQVVERNNMDKILKEQKFQHSGCTDSECAVEIGQLLNADLTVIGTASKFGKTYTLDCRIINVENGEALQSASYTHTGEIDELVKEGIESIAHKLLGMPYKKKISSGTTSKASSGYGATLEINSDPTGAEIYIGGNFFDTTPLVLEDFPIGDYEVALKLEGYEDYSESVKLLPRGSETIFATLTAIQSIISISGIPTLSKVKVFINDVKQDMGYYSDLKIPPGKYNIRVSKEGYIGHEETITVEIGETTYVNYELDKNAGLLKLTINPSKATVYIDASKESKYTELTPGMHTLKVSQPGYDDYTGEFEIKLDETTELNIELNRQYGHLDLNLEPYNATVYFNDSLALSFNVPMDLNSNTFEFKLETGTYNVRAEKPYFYSKSMMATINNKERTQLMLSLKSGDEDLKKLRKNRKLGYMATGIIATAFVAEYLLGKSSYKSYENATTATDAQKYRDKNEMFTTLKTPTATLLGVSAGFTLYTTINLERLKTKLGLK